jgi:hypothetical protein
MTDWTNPKRGTELKIRTTRSVLANCNRSISDLDKAQGLFEICDTMPEVPYTTLSWYGGLFIEVRNLKQFSDAIDIIEHFQSNGINLVNTTENVDKGQSEQTWSYVTGPSMIFINLHLGGDEMLDEAYEREDRAQDL